MRENEIAREIVDAAYGIHVELGPGLLESAYEAVLAYELRERGLGVACQVPMPLVYKGVRMDVGYRADMVVEDRVIVELKSSNEMHPVYMKQLHTYLRLSDRRLGLVLNFGLPLMKDGIRRVVNGLHE